MMYKKRINTVACLDSDALAVKAPGLVEWRYLRKSAEKDRIVFAPYISGIQRSGDLRQSTQKTNFATIIYLPYIT